MDAATDAHPAVGAKVPSALLVSIPGEGLASRLQHLRHPRCHAAELDEAATLLQSLGGHTYRAEDRDLRAEQGLAKTSELQRSCGGRLPHSIAGFRSFELRSCRRGLRPTDSTHMESLFGDWGPGGRSAADGAGEELAAVGVDRAVAATGRGGGAVSSRRLGGRRAVRTQPGQNPARTTTRWVLTSLATQVIWSR